MRLIDADALKKAILGDIDTGDNVCDTGYLNAMYMCLEYIENAPVLIECGITSDGLPLLDMQPTPQGKWIYKCCYGDEFPQCSVCGEINDVKSRFCPDCGAQMEGGEHG